MAQVPPMVAAGGVPLKTTFVPLGPSANAIVIEPVTPNQKSRIALLVTHPEHANNFSYFHGLELPKFGYRALLLNYYGKETTYYEFLQPIAAAIRALRAMPGVEKVILAGHSSGGAELSSYQDVAENGPAACQGAERAYKCQNKEAENLPRADGIMLLDANTGAAEKTMALNPAVDEHHPRQVDAVVDLYDPRNGYDVATHSATYNPEFLKKFFAAQSAKARRVIAEARDRLAKIEKGDGEYRDDEPFVVAGAGVNASGARVEMADIRLMARTHAPHPLLKADGTNPTQVIPRIATPAGDPYKDLLAQTTMDTTVRHYLSFQALPVTSDYRITEDNVLGVQWRGTANSMQGNLEGVRVPTLIMAATCATALVLLEIGYDHSVANDKEFVGVEGANHNFQPCKPEYGNTFKRAFDYMDAWLSKAGRFTAQAADIKVLSTIAFQRVFEEELPAFNRTSGHAASAEFGGTTAMARRVQNDEVADVYFGTRPAIDALLAAGKVRPDSVVDLANSQVGLAVRKGAPRPDISTADALRRALLSAKGITYPDPATGSVSALHIEKLAQQLGMAEALRARTRRPPGAAAAGPTMLTTGEADLAFQQNCELLLAPDVELLGPLPAEFRLVTVMSAAVPVTARAPAAGSAFIRYLQTPAAAAVMQRWGLEPLARTGAGEAPRP